MNIKIPKLRVVRPQHYTVVTEGIIKQFLYVCFWLSWLIPFGAWKAYDLIIILKG
jgi:hypothetical protein